MTRYVTSLAGLCLLLGTAHADEPARKLLERGIQAHGGTTPLERAATMVRSAAGKMIFNGQETAFTSDLHCDLPDRYRLDVEIGPEKRRHNLIIGRDKGWMIVGGLTQELGRARHAEAQAEGYSLYLTTLVPIRDSKGFTLKSLPEAKVAGKPADVIQVSQQGRVDIHLFFDKNTGLLVQLQRRASLAGLVTTKEYVFAEHKEFRGAKLPTHYIEQINGQKSMEFKDASYKLQGRPDERLFGKP